MVLRLCLLAAQWLLPGISSKSEANSAPGSGQEDLCPLKSESLRLRKRSGMLRGQQQDEETNLWPERSPFKVD